MSESSYFDDTLDSEFLDEVDALETGQQPTARDSALDIGQGISSKDFGTTDDASSARTRVHPSHQNHEPFGEVFDLDDLEEIDDDLVRDMSGPSNTPAILARIASKTFQTTLWGGRVPDSPTKTTSHTQPSNERMRKTKTWDKTAFAKSGWKATRPPAKAEAKVKGKGRANVDDEEEQGEEMLLLEGFPDITEYTSSEPFDQLLIFL
jgi:hypothetical protein